MFYGPGWSVATPSRQSERPPRSRGPLALALQASAHLKLMQMKATSQAFGGTSIGQCPRFTSASFSPSPLTSSGTAWGAYPLAITV